MQEPVYEIRLKLDTTNSWLEAVGIAERLETQIRRFADHSNTPIDWHDRVEQVLGAPHLLLKAPSDFISKIERFPEVVAIEIAPYATKPRANDNNAAAAGRPVTPRPPRPKI
jgi:hypothetical protein